MRIFLTGSQGQIGWELRAALSKRHEIAAVDVGELDLTDEPAVRAAVRAIKPDLIVNASGYTAVDRAETEPQLARAVNETAVGILAEEARRLGAAMVHYSTDYVFDGTKRTPYTPDDRPNPQSVYAQTKLDGEIALINSGTAYLVIRTSWVYGLRGRNFLLAMLDLAGKKPELRVVNDQTGCPTWCRVVAQGTAFIIERAVVGNPKSAPGLGKWTFGGREGIYHLCCAGATTWFDFARRIFDLAGVHPPPKLIPISTEEYAARAARPKYSVLDCSKTRDAFGVPIAEWGAALEELLIENRAAAPASG